MRPHQTHGEAHARCKLHNLTRSMVNNSYRNAVRNATFTYKLPVELLQHVFRVLPSADLARLSATCKYFREVCLEDSLWLRHIQDALVLNQAPNSQRTDITSTIDGDWYQQKAASRDSSLIQSLPRYSDAYFDLDAFIVEGQTSSAYQIYGSFILPGSTLLGLHSGPDENGGNSLYYSYFTHNFISQHLGNVAAGRPFGLVPAFVWCQLTISNALCAPGGLGWTDRSRASIEEEMAGIEFQSALGTAEIVIEPGSATLAAVGPEGLIIAEMLVPHRSLTHQTAFIWGLPSRASPLLSGQSARLSSTQYPARSVNDMPGELIDDVAAHVAFPHQLCNFPLDRGIEIRRELFSAAANESDYRKLILGQTKGVEYPSPGTSEYEDFTHYALMDESLQDGGVSWPGEGTAPGVNLRLDAHIMVRKAGFLRPALRPRSTFLRAFKSDDEADVVEHSTFQMLRLVARQRTLPLLSLNSIEQLPRWRIPQRNAEGEYNHIAPPAHLDPGDDAFDFDSVTGLYAATYGPHGIEILYVHTRILEAADFEGGRAHDVFDTYNFGSEAMYRGTSSLSRADVRPGVRMIEAIKVRGDFNVPSAQVTWRAFIVPHLAEPGRMWAAPRSKMKREHAPFPFSKFGRSFPGVGRIASHGFRSPQWTQATVHITSPDEIRVTWLQSTACCKRIWGL